MARYASGKKSLAISDISGLRVPYTKLRTTWDGLRVSPEDFDPKQPQLTPAKNVVDATALFNPRPDTDPENVVVYIGFTQDWTIDPRLLPPVGVPSIGTVGYVNLEITSTQTGVGGTGAVGTETLEMSINEVGVAEDDSTELTNSIDQIIDQAETMIFQRLPNLPCFRKITTDSLVAGTAEYTVASARMIRQVSVISSNVVSYLNHRVDSYLRDYWPNATTQGTPIMYSTKSASTAGMVITLAPTPDAADTIQVDYIAPETGLSSGNANNWISDNAEAVLLAACLYEASAFLKAGETLALYKTQFDEAVQLLIQEMQRDYAAEYNGGI
jgi:hypothetical protein